MLEGKNVNLRVAEKEDLSLLSEWFNSPEFAGRYDPLDAQESKADIEKRYEKLGSEKNVVSDTEKRWNQDWLFRNGSCGTVLRDWLRTDFWRMR